MFPANPTRAVAGDNVNGPDFVIRLRELDSREGQRASLSAPLSGLSSCFNAAAANSGNFSNNSSDAGYRLRRRPWASCK